MDELLTYKRWRFHMKETLDEIHVFLDSYHGYFEGNIMPLCLLTSVSVSLIKSLVNV